MAYAGAMCLLQNYKMMKCESDFKLTTYQNELLEATQASADLNALNSEKQAELKRELVANPEKANDAEYLSREADLEEDFNKALAEIAADEQVWQMKVDSENTTNALLQKNIENFQSMVQNNVPKAHQYGYGQ